MQAAIHVTTLGILFEEAIEPPIESRVHHCLFIVTVDTHQDSMNLVLICSLGDGGWQDNSQIFDGLDEAPNGAGCVRKVCQEDQEDTSVSSTMARCAVLGASLFEPSTKCFGAVRLRIVLGAESPLAGLPAGLMVVR
jgi:hypothetical protein